MPDATNDSGSATVPLAPGVDVRCAMTELDGTVEVGIEHEGEVVDSDVIDPATPGKHFKLDLGRPNCTPRTASSPPRSRSRRTGREELPR